MSAAAIPLAVNPPQPGPSPVATIGQLMQYRGLASEIALRQQQAQQMAAQTADVQAQAQQRQQQIRDQTTVMQVMADPAANARIHLGNYSDLEGKVTQPTLDALEQHRSTLANNLLAQTKEQNAIQVDAKKQITDALTGKLFTHTDSDGKVDLDAINQGMPSSIAALATPLKNAGLTGAVPQSFSSAEQIKGIIANLGGGIALQNDVLAKQKAQAETAASTATAAKTQAEIPGAKIASERAQMELELFKQLRANPTAGDNVIDRAIQDPTIRETTKVMAHAATSYADWEAAINKGLADERSQQSQVAVKKSEAGTLEAIAAANATATANAQHRASAIDALSKSESSVGAVQANVDRLKYLLGQAQQNNNSTAALAVKQSMGVFNLALQGTHRASNAVMDQSPGSAWDKLQGLVGGIVEGQPIPKRVFDEAPGVLDSAVREAQQAHNAMADTNNREWSLNFPKFPVGGAAPAGQPAARTAQGGYQIGHKYGGLTYLGGDPKDRANSWR